MALPGTPVLMEAESPKKTGPRTRGVPGECQGPPSCRPAFWEGLRGRGGAEGADSPAGVASHLPAVETESWEGGLGLSKALPPTGLARQLAGCLWVVTGPRGAPPRGDSPATLGRTGRACGQGAWRGDRWGRGPLPGPGWVGWRPPGPGDEARPSVAATINMFVQGKPGREPCALARRGRKGRLCLHTGAIVRAHATAAPRPERSDAPRPRRKRRCRGPLHSLPAVRASVRTRTSGPGTGGKVPGSPAEVAGREGRSRLPQGRFCSRIPGGARVRWWRAPGVGRPAGHPWRPDQARSPTQQPRARLGPGGSLPAAHGAR